MYDAQIGRWHNIDPLVEYYKPYSTYSYTINNPIRFVDIEGKAVGIIFGEARVVASVPKYPGITLSVQVAVLLDDNGNFGVSVMPTAGLGYFASATLGFGVGINWEAESINDLDGWGVGIGATKGKGVRAFTGEYNWSFKEGEAYDGALSAVRGSGGGYGIYADVGKNFVFEVESLSAVVDLIYSESSNITNDAKVIILATMIGVNPQDLILDNFIPKTQMQEILYGIYRDLLNRMNKAKSNNEESDEQDESNSDEDGDPD